jgi:hypothetical protein
MATHHIIPTHERLWQILNDLERLKALEYQNNSNQHHVNGDAPSDASNLHLLYEVEEAVLPLISALEHASAPVSPLDQVASYVEVCRAMYFDAWWLSSMPDG